MSFAKQNCPYFTWGCADDLTCRLKKTLYCSDDHDCYKSSSAALTDVVVSMFTEAAPCPRRKLKFQYASSLVRQLSLTPCALMLGILYSERLRQSNPSYRERVSSSDLYVVSLLVASKFLHDEGEAEEIFNEEWAEAAGLSVKTVNRLEKEFLDAMDWNVYATPLEFLDVCARVETKIALQYGLRRGWFSYTDLTQFLLASNYPHLLSGIAESVVKIIGGCVLVYGMSLSILTSSMMCLIANNSNAMKSPDITKFSCNDTSSATNNHMYTDCFLTRRRQHRIGKNTSQNVNQSDDDVLVNKDLEDRLLGNQTSSIVYPSNKESPVTLPETCFCKRNNHLLCFEPRFGHLSHQTKLRLPPEVTPINRFCDEMFFSDSSSSCECSRSLSNKKLASAILTKGSRNNHFEIAMSRKFHARNLMLNPSILGMAIM